MIRTDDPALRTDALDRLPIRSALPALLTALDERGAAVLYGPPGTGKTTLVPLALAGLLPGPRGGRPRRVLVAEPRRMAVRAAARRMAWLLGEEPGERVGFTVRGERRCGPRTVVEVVTTGVLLQRLQRDPELPGVDTVLLDECHERHLDADTALAFLLDVRATLRPELEVIAASATSDLDAWSRLLGRFDPAGPVPVVRGRGSAHPVRAEHAPPPAGVRPPHGTRVDPAFLRHVAATVRATLREPEGDLLCFLPGVGEIGRVAALLEGATAPDGTPTEVLQLHGQAPAAVQESVLAGGDGRRRRIVLSTSVAESSLTVPGVRIVVDSGLAREPRTDQARGLGSLATVRVSRAAAEQRQGRAGREAPGVVVRCWAEADDASRPRWPAPEIAVADLTTFALQAACWGDPGATGLALLDAPPAGALAAAREVLRCVGAVARPDGADARGGGNAPGAGAGDRDGPVTERGKAMARLGLHPRLARALMDGAREVGARRAAEVVALLSEEPPRAYGDDVVAAWRTARRGGDGYAARWRAEVRRLLAAVERGPSAASLEHGLPAAGERGASAAAGAAPPGGGHGQHGDARAAAGGRGTGAAPAEAAGNREGGLVRTAEHHPSEAGPARAGSGAADSRAPARGGGGATGGRSSARKDAPSAAAGGGPADSRAPARDGGGATGGRSSARKDAPGAAAGGGPADGRVPARDGGAATGGRSSARKDAPGAAAGGGPVGGAADSRSRASTGAPGPAGGAPGVGDDAVAGLVVALAFPERVARARGGGDYLMASGTAARLADGSRLGSAPWLAVAVADRPVGAPSARVRLAAVLDEETAVRAAGTLRSDGEEVTWSEERADVVARRVERLGAIELSARPLAEPDPVLLRAALLEGLRREGTGLLREGAGLLRRTREADELRQRMAFLHRELGEPWPDVSEEALLARAEEWLGVELGRARKRADLARVDAAAALGRLLPWATGEAARLDELAPERIEVPSGSRVRVDYGGERPVLAVKLQEMFGLRRTPRVADGRVPVLVHLLSPAG
ncbi:ATP-dependent helicase C-terminal domain-containing protein, partial [Streptomyces sp. URMC 123]|uniref:ATP-dependent helicase C-terminal domain-containing protein n=1 Tax=Streptomyces sp. URMC 123 TaxID=3423403 RepID=UPI003F1C5E08